MDPRFCPSIIVLYIVASVAALFGRYERECILSSLQNEGMLEGRALPLGCAFTMRNAFIRRTATGRPGRSTKRNAGGQDRLRRTVLLPPASRARAGTGEMLTVALMP